MSQLLVETRGRVMELTLNRPEAMNAMSPEMTQGLSEALTRFEADDDLWVALITGAGERAFCAGADLGRMQQTLEAHGEGIRPPNTLVPPWELDLTKPVIAAVNGHCLAGGLGLALICDVRIASDNATFGCMGTVRGIVPGAGQTQRLPRLIGPANAMWLLLSAERIKADEALRIGLVNKVVSQAEVLPEARRWADILAQRAPLAVRAAKEAATKGLTLSLSDGLKLESQLAAPVRRSADAVEGVKAFNEKRTAVFTGR